jgi:hypothetical protein
LHSLPKKKKKKSIQALVLFNTLQSYEFLRSTSFEKLKPHEHMLVHFAPFWSMFCLDFSAVVLIVVGGLDDVVCLVIIVKVANDI